MFSRIFWLSFLTQQSQHVAFRENKVSRSFGDRVATNGAFGSWALGTTSLHYLVRYGISVRCMLGYCLAERWTHHYDRQQLFDKIVTIITPVTFDSRIDEHQTDRAEFRHSDSHHQRLTNVVLVRRCFTPTSLSFEAADAYSTVGHFDVANVNMFLSLNQIKTDSHSLGDCFEPLNLSCSLLQSDLHQVSL